MADEARRSTDTWTGKLSFFWDWIDKRDIDKHLVSLIILAGTAQLTLWAEHFAENGNRPGIEVAAILAAVFAPYMLLQGAALKWYFGARGGQS
jgi:hypothetical protein